MPYEDEQAKQHVKDIFNDRPKLYKDPLPKKTQQVTAKASPKGKVKVFTEEEVFLFRLKRFKRPRFNF